MALDFDISSTQKLKIYYAKGLTYENKKNP